MAKPGESGQVEAMQFTSESKDQVFNFVTCDKFMGSDKSGNPTLTIQMPDGNRIVSFGDFVIRDRDNTFHVSKSLQL
jgi:hypothetical protein